MIISMPVMGDVRDSPRGDWKRFLRWSTGNLPQVRGGKAKTDVVFSNGQILSQ